MPNLIQRFRSIDGIGNAYNADMAERRFQFRLHTLLIAVVCFGVYLTLFGSVWYWMLLLSTGALPFTLTLLLVRVWTNLPAEKRTVVRAVVFTGVSVLWWFPWIVFFVLGPGQAVFDGVRDMTSGYVRDFLNEWNAVWMR